MMNKSSEQPVLLTKTLQRSFETAVRDIYEVGLTGKASRYRSPIRQHDDPVASESSLHAEKRALSDAARALAQLWKLPQTSGR